MKKIIVLVLLLISFNSFGQYYPMGSKFAKTNGRYILIDSLRNGTFSDTIATRDYMRYWVATHGGGGGGDVASVFGRTGEIVATTNDYTWAQINKGTSSLADITTRNFSALQNTPTTLSGYGITDGALNTLTLTAGNGLIGGGDLSANRTFRVDSALFTTRLWHQKGVDSLGTLIAAAGASNTNIGSGYRILKPAGQELKTLFNGYAALIDSSTNTNGLTFKVDSSLISTKAWRQKGIDSVITVMNALTTNLSLGTIDDESVEIDNSDGTGVTLPAANTTEAGVATADMYNKYLESFENYYLRNSLASGRKTLYVPNDSTGILTRLWYTSSDNTVTIDSSASNDSLFKVDFIVNEANLSGIAQSSITSLTSDLALKAPLASPALTGVPTAPTAASGTNTTQIATTAFVSVKVVATGTVSAGATIPIDLSSYYTVYDEIIIQFSDLRPVTDNVSMYIRISDDGSTYASGASDYTDQVLYGTGASAGGVANATAAQINAGSNWGNTATNMNTLTITIIKPGQSTLRPKIKYEVGYTNNSAAIVTTVNYGVRNAAQVVRGIQLLTSSGNISGSYAIKGVKY